MDETTTNLLATTAVVLVALVCHAPIVLLDLIRRSDQVSRWWALPTVLLVLGWTGFAALAWLGTPHALAGGTLTVIGAAGLCACIGIGAGAASVALAIARLLRPGHARQGLRGTAVVGLFALLALFVPAALATPDGLTNTISAAPFMGLVLLLARSGDDRLAHARRAVVTTALVGTASLVVGGLVSTAAFPDIGWVEAVISLGTLAVLTAWSVNAVLPSLWGAVVVAAELVVSGLAATYLLLSTAIPTHLGAPLAEDWLAEPTDRFDAQITCFVSGRNAHRWGDCEDGTTALVMDATATTQDLVTARARFSDTAGLALGRGEAMVPWATEAPAVPDVTVVDGRPYYRGEPVSRERLRSHPEGEPLWFEAHERLSVLQFVRFCATATREGCGVSGP